MKSYFSILSLSVGLLSFFGCTNDQIEPASQAQFSSIPENQYYEKDIFLGNATMLYGKWKVIGTSGGFHGGGYQPDFDYLLIKPNAIFGIVRDEELITYGKIKVLTDPDYELLIQFQSEVPANEINVEIIADSQKFVQFKGDTLHLNSLCCDRFNTHLKRVK